jgi:hypothetical protein
MFPNPYPHHVDFLQNIHELLLCFSEVSVRVLRAAHVVIPTTPEVVEIAAACVISKQLVPAQENK